MRSKFGRARVERGKGRGKGEGRGKGKGRSRIFGGLIEHLSKDLEHVHEDVEHVIQTHPELEGSEVGEHLKEVDEHLHDLMRHGEDLKARGSVLPLAFLSVGEEAEIVEMRSGRGMVQRLSEMGFTPSAKVRVLASNPQGPILVGVRDARIALGRGVAMKIFVSSREE